MAEDISTGLTSSRADSTAATLPEKAAPQLRVVPPLARRSKDPLDELSYGKPVRQHINEFGAVFALMACFVAIYKALHLAPPVSIGYWTSGGVIFWGLCVLFPRMLLPVWRGWMGLAHGLGFVVTGILLSVTWAVVVIPMSLILRATGKRVLDSGYRAPVASYWEDRDAKYNDFKLLERQF